MNYCSDVAVYVTEGAMHCDIPDYSIIRKQSKKLTRKIWIADGENTTHKWNAKMLKDCGEAFQHLT